MGQTGVIRSFPSSFPLSRPPLCRCLLVFPSLVYRRLLFTGDIIFTAIYFGHYHARGFTLASLHARTGGSSGCAFYDAAVLPRLPRVDDERRSK